MKQPHHLSCHLLAKYNDREVTGSEAQDIADLVTGSPLNQKRLSTVKRVVDLLSDTSAVDDIDLLPSLSARIKVQQKSAPKTRPQFRIRPYLIGFAAAVLVLLSLPLVWWAVNDFSTQKDNDGFTPRCAQSGDPRSRWIALNVFRLRGHEEPVPLDATLRRDDGLIFAYTNLGPAPFSHLMIFAVDEETNIFWYYPAFLDENSNPKGISIASGVSREAFHEVISHPYREGPLTIYGLFSDTAFSVSEIEHAIKNGYLTDDEYKEILEDARIKSLNVEVEK
jgi:hypothetical protein